MPSTTRLDCVERDAADPLRTLRDQFTLPPGVIYLDGNSLGAAPSATAARLQELVEREWGADLIRSWNTAGWIDLPQRLGDKIARLVGAAPGELVVADSTSINLYKVLSAAIQISRRRAPTRRVIVSERSNFPTDIYVAESLAAQWGWTLRLIERAEELPGALNDEVAVLLLTEVNYRSGYRHDMQALSAAAHAAGALAIWDLAHSAGALPVDLNGADADFAIGCGYKYLNGGPGAPGFVWVHARHAQAELGTFSQPLAGWMGHATPFSFSPHYTPARGIRRYLCGTPPILSAAALECGVDTVLTAEALGGMVALREKSVALTELFIALTEARCARLGVRLASPRLAAQRGSQVSLSLDGQGQDAAHAVMQALIARGVIGDFRAGDPARPEAVPDLLRFGFTPLYVGFAEVYDAVDHLHQVLASAEWRHARFQARGTVT